MSVTCVILASVSHTYSVATMDTTMMILLPFQMLLGEQLESGEWFVKKVKRMDIYNDVKIFLTDYKSGYQERHSQRKRFRRI